MSDQLWHLSFRADPRALPLADAHYNRQSIGSPQFVPPGACVVLLTAAADALWVTSWPKAEYVQHAWAGAWMNSTFRNESPHLSSALILRAVAATRAIWPDVPPLGMVTFVDAGKTRRKRDPGRCYRRAGFKHVGFTQGGLYAFQLPPAAMPPPDDAIGSTPPMFREGRMSRVSALQRDGLLLAIDPGYTQSAWIEYDAGRPTAFDIAPNHDLLDVIHQTSAHRLAIESVASYGMAVGAEVFETCVWAGRFIQQWVAAGRDESTIRRVYRREVKLHLCGSMRAKDPNVRAALIDRYGPGKGKAIGLKASPGPLYGIRADVWAALAVAVTATETAAA